MPDERRLFLFLSMGYRKTDNDDYVISAGCLPLSVVEAALATDEATTEHIHLAPLQTGGLEFTVN